MVKIEVEVKDSENDSCSITVRKPKHLKSATETEIRTANVVKQAIDVSMDTLSKSRKGN